MQSLLIQPLLADIWEWIVPIVFLIIYALNHLLTASKNTPANRPNPQRRRPEAERPLRPAQPQQKPPAPQPEAAQRGNKSQLNSEIEQFLKRANERRMEKARRETQPSSPQPSPPQPSPPQRRQALAPPPAQLQPLREQPVDVKPLERRSFDNVAASVQQHLGTSSFEKRAEHLADDIVRADAQMEQHLQQAFSRRVGTLTSGVAEGAEPLTDTEPMVVKDRSAVAQSLAAMLANPQNIKQAVMLSEILARPVDRW